MAQLLGKMSGGALHVAQSAALPFRLRGGRVEVLLVTGRRSGRWIIPKGHIEPKLGPARSAAQEALEEAGVVGRVRGSPVGRYSYEKGERTYVVAVYELEVDQELEDWPERGQREREWVPASVAAKRIDDDGLRRVVETFEASIQSSSAGKRVARRG